MTAGTLVLHQFRYDQKTFWRNPASVFFTVALPLVFLFIFATIFGNNTIHELGGIKATTYYVPAITTLAVISATFVYPAISVTRQREAGILKRLRGTPLPNWVFIAGRVGNAIVISVLMTALVTIVGRLVYGVALPGLDRIPAILVTIAVGAASFACMGFGLTVLIPTEDAAPAITNAFALPLYFISGIFIPENEIPDGVLSVADVFPFRHFFQAFFSAFDPQTTGSGFKPEDLLVVVVWGIFGLIVAVRYFRWTPSGG
jgi:ABC-2 type transport system permease protein